MSPWVLTLLLAVFTVMAAFSFSAVWLDHAERRRWLPKRRR
jgi:hypothetical protein